MGMDQGVHLPFGRRRVNRVFRFGGGALINFCRRRRRVLFAGGGCAAWRYSKAKFKK